MICNGWKYLPVPYDCYKINSDGVVVSLPRYKVRSERIIKHKPDKDGYLYVTLSINNVKRVFKIHRLLALFFIPNPDNKPQVNHKDGIKSNNKLSNLEWATSSENLKHAYSNGLSPSKKGWKFRPYNLKRLKHAS